MLNVILIINALCLVWLATYCYFKKNTKEAYLFIVFALSLATWNTCVFFNKTIFFPNYVNLVSQIQLTAVLLSLYIFYLFCFLYTRSHRNRWPEFTLATSAFILIVLGLFFTDYVSVAYLEGSKLKFNDGWGFAVYGIYSYVISIRFIKVLIDALRQKVSNKNQVFLLVFGKGVFVFCLIIFNILLPYFGVFDYLFIGYLSSVLLSVIIFYIVTKENFLDLTPVIKPEVSWFMTYIIIFVTVLIDYELTRNYQTIDVISCSLLCLFWAFYAKRFQYFLLTTARRQFLRGWYDKPKLIDTILKDLTNLDSRHSIIENTAKRLLAALNIQSFLLILPVKNQKRETIHFICKKNHFNNSFTEYPSKKIKSIFKGLSLPMKDSAIPFKLRQYIEKISNQPFTYSAIIPFSSAGLIEGILFLGEREDNLNSEDIEILKQIMHYTNSALYRLAPISEIEKKLFQSSRKMKLLEELGAQIAHELRTPLASLQLANQSIENKMKKNTLLAEDKPTFDEFDDLLSKSQKIIMNMNITLDILLNNMKSSKFIIGEHEEFTAVKLIEQSIEEYPFKSNSQKELIKVQYDNDFTITGSLILLKYTIFNMLKNAFYYIEQAHKGDITIWFETNDQFNQIHIHDTSSGIPSSILPHIYDAFYSSKTAADGHGLGLSFCKRVLESHHGEIDCQTEEKSFTEFILKLPKLLKKD